MDAVLLIYTVLLLVLYSISLTMASLYFIQTKKPVYLYTLILFLFYILDRLIIHMTEAIPWFSAFYDNTFMSVPTFKTIIFVVTLFCLTRINSIILQQHRTFQWDVALLIYALILLFIPMFPDNAMKAWVYYLPNQIFTFVLGLYGITILKKNPEQYDSEFFKQYRKVLIWTMIFSILIVIEDTIVIFNFDSYTAFSVKINTRNISDDIMSIGYAAYVIKNLLRNLEIHYESVLEKADDVPSPGTGSTEDTLPAVSPVLEQNTDNYSKFYLFCKEYQLTTREQDILTLLLENKNNQEISDSLLISVGTAKTHTHNIFQKIGVTKRQQLLDRYNNYEPEEEKE